MSLGDSRQTLFQWYDKYVGEAASRREVYGYWTFVFGYVVGILGVLVYLLDPGGRGALLLVREVAIATSAVGLSLSLLGIALQLPVRRPAVWAALVGAAVSVVGVAFFVTVYPSNWLGADSPQRTVIAVYVLGVGIVAGVVVLIPILTGERGFLLSRDFEDEGQGIMVGEAERGGLFAVFRRGPADWRWRLLEQNAVADGVEGFASRPDVESVVESVRSKVREAAMLEINHAAFRLYGGDGSWKWILMEEDGSAVATSVAEFSDRDAAEESANVFKEFGRDADLLDIDGAAFDVDRAGTDWTWRLLDERREPLAVAPSAFDSRDAADESVGRFREAAGAADVLALEHLGFEVRREDGTWRWRLVDRGDETVARATTTDDSREGVRDRVDAIRDWAADAVAVAETDPRFELVAADDGGDAWEWRLVDGENDVRATNHGAPTDEDAARADVDDLRRHAGDAGVVEGEDAAFEIHRAEEGWRWRLVDGDRDVVERGTDAYEDREAVEEAVDHVVEQTAAAELVEFEEAAFQIYEAEGGDWRWRLIDEGGGVLTESGEDFDSRDAAVSGMSVIQEHAPNADLLEIDDAAIELFRDEGDWGWRLVDEGGTTIAESGSLRGSKAAAKDAAGRMRDLVAAAEVRPIVDGAFQVYETTTGDGTTWRWRYLGADGRVVADGATGNPTRKGAERAVEDVREAVADASTHAIERFAFVLAPTDEGWGWRLADRDRESVAASVPTYADRDAAASAVAEIKDHLADAETFELGGPVYRVRERPDGDWEWRLVDRSWTPIADAPATYDDRDAAEAAADEVAALAPDAGVLEYEDAAYELFVDGGEWRWRLIDEGGESRAVSASAFETRDAAREALERVRDVVVEASVLEIETASFELYEGDDGWRWRLVDRRGETVAESVRSYSTRTAAREGMQSLKEHAPDAGLVVGG